jgi:hypothetical protein
MQRLLALLLTLSLNLGLPAADPSGKVVEFPAAPKTKADQTAQLVFAISTSKEIEIISLDPILRIDENKKTSRPLTGFTVSRSSAPRASPTPRKSSASPNPSAKPSTQANPPPSVLARATRFASPDPTAR